MLLSNSYFSTKTTLYAAHLQSNDATANDDHLFWDLLQKKRTSRADDLLLVHLNGAAREGCDLGPCRNDNVLRLHSRLAALVGLHGDGIGRYERDSSLNIVDFVPLEEQSIPGSETTTLARNLPLQSRARGPYVLTTNGWVREKKISIGTQLMSKR